LSSHLLSKNIRIRIYKTIILLVLLWHATLQEEHRLKAFENGAEENIWTEEG
jgi:hypothetical protein